MKRKKQKSTEMKATSYMESNIKIIQKIKSEENQKRINKLVAHIYVYEEED